MIGRSDKGNAGRGGGCYGCLTGALEDAQDLAAGHGANLGDTVAVTKDDTDLGGGHALLGQLADVLLDLKGADSATHTGRQQRNSSFAEMQK